ncbi:MAG: hypothetical protein KBT04_02310 [Bacteroidales bacterium]|nr:hypothetical protein [Candidatus Colimorpha onthohippi]
MKKGIIAIAALALLSFGTINAQDPFDGGRFGIEVEFMPNLNGSNFFNLPYGLSGSYRLNNGDKVFVGFQLDNQNTNNGAFIDKDDEDYDKLSENYDKTTLTNVMLGVTYQHYFIKEGRIRPFAGAFASIGRGFGSRHTYTNYFNNIDNTWYYEEITQKNNNCDFTWRLGVGVGLDVYITKGLYIGTHVGIAGSMSSRLDSTIEVESDDPAVETGTTELYNKFRTGNIMTDISAKLRLGWEF